jgi:hypothetical protein
MPHLNADIKAVKILLTPTLKKEMIVLTAISVRVTESDRIRSEQAF